MSGCGLKARKAQRNRVCVTVFVLGEQRPKPASKRCLSANTKVCFGGVLGVRGLAEQVRLQVNPLQDILRHAQNRIHGLDLFVSEKGETCNSEQSVERIHHVSWSISKTSGLLVLTGQNKPSELGLVDPVDPADDFQRRQNPPRVAHIWKLLRSSIEASGWQLPLAEPPAQQVSVHLVQLTGERQEASAAVNLTSMRL